MAKLTDEEKQRLRLEEQQRSERRKKMLEPSPKWEPSEEFIAELWEILDFKTWPKVG